MRAQLEFGRGATVGETLPAGEKPNDHAGAKLLFREKAVNLTAAGRAPAKTTEELFYRGAGDV